MLRYAVFAGRHFYPQGGAQDFKGSFADLDEAINLARTFPEWSHVYDTESLKFCFEQEEQGREGRWNE